MDPPKQGAIIDGYAYLGGDPSKMESWKKADAAPEAVAATGAPRVGQVVDGHAYLGGDPSKQESWKAQKNYDAADVPLTAISNLPASALTEAGNMVEGVKHMVQHPVDTASTFGRLGLSTNPLAPILGLVAPHLPEGMREKVQPALDWLNEPKNAMMQEYAQKYGGWENFKRTVAENPVSFLMDATIPFTGGAPATTKAGKIGQVVAKASDPVGLASSAASVARKGVTESLGVTTGAGPAALKDAFDAGKVGGNKGQTFRRAIKEEMPAEEIVGIAQQGMQNIRDKMFSAYKNDKAVWEQQHGRLNFSPIDKAYTDLQNSLFSNSGVRAHSSLPLAERKQIAKLGDVIAEWRADPAAHTIEGLDTLKQRLRNEVNFKSDHDQVVRAATKLSNSVLDTIKTLAPPQYRKAMKEYTESSRLLDQLERSFSLGRDDAAHTAMSKLQSVMRNNASTQYGIRSKDMANLETLGDVSLRPALAGSALNSWSPRGIGRGVMGAGAPAAAGLAFSGLNPLTLGGAALGLASTSPRLVGEMYHGMGRLAGAPGRTLNKYAGKFSEPIKDVGRGAFSPMARQLYRMEGDSLPPEEEQRARGGYLRRKAH
jgi:hypothetical protein